MLSSAPLRVNRLYRARRGGGGAAPLGAASTNQRASEFLPLHTRPLRRVLEDDAQRLELLPRRVGGGELALACARPAARRRAPAPRARARRRPPGRRPRTPCPWRSTPPAGARALPVKERAASSALARATSLWTAARASGVFRSSKSAASKAFRALAQPPRLARRPPRSASASRARGRGSSRGPPGRGPAPSKVKLSACGSARRRARYRMASGRWPRATRSGMVKKFPLLLDIVSFSTSRCSTCIQCRDERQPRAALALRDLVLVMGEDQVDAARGAGRTSPPRYSMLMAEHSMCQPGRPRPKGASHCAQAGSSGLNFHSAKSRALSLSYLSVPTRAPDLMPATSRRASHPYPGKVAMRKYTLPSAT